MIAPNRLRLLIPIILIVALAFGFRLIIMADRAAAPNELSHWDPLPDGHDQATYIQQLHDLQSGDFPPKSFYFQPGIVYFLAFVAALVQSNDLLSLRLFLIALASVNCGLIAVLTWWSTGRRNAGIAAGLLLAIYPVGACYDTDFVITSQALIVATLMFCCAWLAKRRPRNLLAPIMVGLLTGAGAITRFELIAPGVICMLWLLLQRRDALGLRQFSLGALAALLVIAPVALHNRAGGANHLISSEGPRLVYQGNNRDSPGTYGPSNASSATRISYFHYLLQDIALEPGRFLELSLHKAALFLSGVEPGNNLDFRKSCQDISPLLSLNPFSFPFLLVLSLWGLLAMWLAGMRSLARLLLAAGASYGLIVLVTMVESRLKTPVIAWMIPAAGFAIDRALILIRRGISRRLIQRSVFLLSMTAVLLLFINWGATMLPRDVTVRELPPDATAANLRYDETLELVGWKVREQYSPRNTIEPFHPWVVSLYWRLLEPATTDYSFSLKYRIGGETLLEYDRPLGYTVFPRDYTSKWQVGKIYVEHIGLTWRGYDGPFERTGRVTVDVYPGRELHNRFIPHDAAGNPVSHPILAQPAILVAPGRYDLATSEAVSFGEQLLLLGYQLPQTGTAGETLPVRTAWRSGRQQIESDYAIGIYAILDGVFLANEDGPPSDGALQTFSLLPGYHFDDEKWLTLPQTPGLYEIFVGVYDLESMLRLPLAGDGQDNLYHIGSISVK